MKSETYSTAEITQNVSDKGAFLLLQIVRRYKADDSAKTFDEVIIEFGNRFNGPTDVIAFQKTRLFKSIYKAAKTHAPC